MSRVTSTFSYTYIQKTNTYVIFHRITNTDWSKQKWPIRRNNQRRLIKKNNRFHGRNHWSLSHLERIFFPGIFVITLNNFSVYSKTKHVITDFIVIGDRCDFWQTDVASCDRVFHGFPFGFHGRNLFLFRRHLDLYFRCSFPFSFLILLVLLADGPLALSKMVIDRQSRSHPMGEKRLDS